MDEPTATAIQFATPDPNVPGGPWALTVTVTGSGFVARGLPLLARIGAEPVQAIFLYPDGSGFNGQLANTPADGDALILGYAAQTTTDLVFQSGAVA